MSWKRVNGVFAALIFSLGTNVVAQQPDTTAQPDRQGVRQHRRLARPAALRRHRLQRIAERLNLSQSQREQLVAIHQRQFAALKPQREELFNLREKRRAGTFTDEDAARAKVLRLQIRDSRQSTRTEVQGVLTPEQRAQIEEFRNARKARREEMREHFQRFRKERP